MNRHTDCAVAWDWEYDSDFINAVDHAFQHHGARFLSVSYANLPHSLGMLQSGRLTVRTFLDRASDTDEKFLPLAQAARLSGAHLLNFPEAVRHAADKATMHLELLTSGIDVPYTVIISPYSEQKELELSLSQISRLGRPFIIKPANTTGGGTGVIVGAETLKDVLESRQHHKNDKYLLQEHVNPAPLGENVGWFRVFWAFGKTLPCWWHPQTHLYREVTAGETDEYRLSPLWEIAERIRHIATLDFFSTEIALTTDGRFVAVDYVNDICDMRLQSRFADGVPDRIVFEICDAFAKFVKAFQS